MNTEVRDATVAVLPIDNNKILLVLNRGEEERTLPSGKKFPHPSKWGMPRGRREPKDKNEIATGEREAKEETNQWIQVDSRYRVEEMAGDHVHVAFIGYPVAGELKPDSKEIIDARWFSPRVLWIEDPKDKDYLDMHPRQRRMAQKLLQLQKRQS